MIGPVSKALEAELRDLARAYGIVVWLDVEGTYTTFADGLADRAADGEFDIRVRRFRGSYLEMMLALENDLDQRLPLIVHVPGHNKESIKQTPLLEVYSAGRAHERNLATVVRQAALGLAPPDAIDKFLAGEVTVEAAAAWLASPARVAVRREQRAARGQGARGAVRPLPAPVRRRLPAGRREPALHPGRAEPAIAGPSETSADKHPRRSTCKDIVDRNLVATSWRSRTSFDLTCVRMLPHGTR